MGFGKDTTRVTVGFPIKAMYKTLDLGVAIIFDFLIFANGIMPMVRWLYNK